MISKFFKYDVIQRDFKQLQGNKEFSVIVDAVALLNNK
jgi:hypothetical protein